MGTVRDQYHKPLVGAEITIANQQTKQIYRTDTDKAGEYKLEVPAGIYTITAEFLGFNPKKVFGIVVVESRRKLVLPMNLPKNTDGDFVTGASLRA